MHKTIGLVLGAFVAVWNAYTLSAIVLYGGAVLVDPSTTSRILAVRTNGIVHSAVGLTYHGVGGAILVLFEIATILAAMWYGLRGYGLKRRIAALVLVAWAALWLGNAIWLRSFGWDNLADFAIISTAMVVTIAWASLCMTEAEQSGADRL